MNSTSNPVTSSTLPGSSPKEPARPLSPSSEAKGPGSLTPNQRPVVTGSPPITAQKNGGP
jgi:hypothetical protein